MAILNVWPLVKMLSALAFLCGSFLCPFVSLISSIVYYPWVRAPGTELKQNRSAELERWKILRVSQAPEGSPGQRRLQRGESPPMRVRPGKGKLARVVPDSLRSWARTPRGVDRGEARGDWKCHEGLGLGV